APPGPEPPGPRADPGDHHAQHRARRPALAGRLSRRRAIPTLTPMPTPPASLSPSYITTPIYYVNDRPHIGHVYSTLLGDVLARFHRLEGRDVFFLTGTDEHADKVVESAAKHGMTPLQWADRNAAEFETVFREMGF